MNRQNDLKADLETFKSVAIESDDHHVKANTLQ